MSDNHVNSSSCYSSSSSSSSDDGKSSDDRGDVIDRDNHFEHADSAWHTTRFPGGDYALTLRDGWDPDCTGNLFKCIGISSSRCGGHGSLESKWLVSDARGRVVGRLEGDENTSSGMLTIVAINRPIDPYQEGSQPFIPHADDVLISIEENKFLLRMPGSRTCDASDIGYMRIETTQGRTLFEVMRTYTGSCAQCNPDGWW